VSSQEPKVGSPFTCGDVKRSNHFKATFFRFFGIQFQKHTGPILQSKCFFKKARSKLLDNTLPTFFPMANQHLHYFYIPTCVVKFGNHTRVGLTSHYSWSQSYEGALQRQRCKN
jgi:hypothetical protein